MSKWSKGFRDDLNKMTSVSCYKTFGWMCLAGIAIFKAVDNAYRFGQGNGALVMTDHSTPLQGFEDPDIEET